MIKIELNNPGFTSEMINNFMLIYKVTNQINQKSYVGKTELSFNIRKNNHLSDTRRGCEFAFHRALRKYGEENFVWEIVEDGIEDKTLLDDKERHYIALYESFGPKGYNMSEGGEGQTGWVPSDKTRAKWSEQRKGKAPWNKGTAKPKKILTEEERAARKADANRRRSEAQKGKKTWNTGLKDVYGRTTYKVTYKDGTEKIGKRFELGLTKGEIDYMFKDNCGSRKYNIKSIERLIDDKDRTE
jgi:group I intron endonuclease